MTYADKIRGILSRGGIPVKDLWYSGSHGIATLHSRSNAERVVSILTAAGFDNVRMTESIDYRKKNEGTNLVPSVISVWRVGFRV